MNICIYRRGGCPLLTLCMFRVAWAWEGDFFNDPGGGFNLVLRSGAASRRVILKITTQEKSSPAAALWQEGWVGSVFSKQHLKQTLLP